MHQFKAIWDVTPETAHPRARELLTEPFIWNFTNENSPLGTDTGADTFADYLEFRTVRPVGGIQEFIKACVASHGYPEDWDLLDETRLEQLFKTDADAGRFLVRRDDFIIGLAFAQLVLEGAIDPIVCQRAITAIRRQATDAVLAFRGGEGPEEWKKQLAEFQKILETA